MTVRQWIGGTAFIVCTVISLIGITGFFGAKGDTAEEKRAHIREIQRQTLADLYREKPGVQARLEKAAGYAVFSNMNVKIFMIGSGNGYGVAVDNATKKETFMKMLEVGGGVGLGVSDLRAVMIFHDKEAFKKFIDTGLEFSGKASAEGQVGDQGMAARQEAKIAAAGEEDVQLVQGVEVYQLTKNGVMAQAMLYGTKYWKDSDLN
jgi:lipid-binding SYLF domain-containing protein